MVENPMIKNKTISLSVIVPVSDDVFRIQGNSPKMGRRIKNAIYRTGRLIFDIIKYGLAIIMMMLIGPVVLTMIKYKNKYDYSKIKYWKVMTVSVIITLIVWMIIVIYVINNIK